MPAGKADLARAAAHGQLAQSRSRTPWTPTSNGDSDKALAVWRRDEEVDDLYTSLFRELLTYMMEDPRNITPCTHLLFVAKNIERIGDHATNIAENIHYLIEPASRSPSARPKGDREHLPVVDLVKPKPQKEIARPMKPMILVVEDEAPWSPC